MTFTNSEFTAAIEQQLGVALTTRDDGLIDVTRVDRHNGYTLSAWQSRGEYTRAIHEYADAHAGCPVDKVGGTIRMAVPLAFRFFCSLPGFRDYLRGLVRGVLLASSDCDRFMLELRDTLGDSLAAELVDATPKARADAPQPTATDIREAIKRLQAAHLHLAISEVFQQFGIFGRGLASLPREKYRAFLDALHDIGLRSLAALGLTMRSAGIAPSPTTDGDDPPTDENGNPSAEAIVTTDRTVTVFDASTFRVVDEILIPDGGSFPDMAPLLNNHHRQSCADVLGGATDFRCEGSRWLGKAVFDSNDPEAMKTYGKVRQRYIKSVSIGYRVLDAVEIRPGETAEIDGRKFTAGPTRVLRIAKRWRVYELSITPIGADAAAKFRNATQPLTGGSSYETAVFAERARVLHIHAMAEQLNDDSDLRSEVLAAGWTSNRYALGVIRSQALARYDAAAKSDD